MSFVCLKCGERDDPHWRNTYFDPHTSIMNWDDFQNLLPTIAEGFSLEIRSIVKPPYAYERSPLTKWPPVRVKRGTIEEFEARGGTFEFHHLKNGSFLDAAHRKKRHKQTLQMFGSFRVKPQLELPLDYRKGAKASDTR